MNMRVKHTCRQISVFYTKKQTHISVYGKKSDVEIYELLLHVAVYIKINSDQK